MSAPAHEHWSSRTGFMLATIGSAVGLGSIWKFPYEVGANGGSAFVLFYLLGLLLIVLPLMLVEFAVGRRGGQDASGSLALVARTSEASPHWAWAGVLGVATSFLILSFYSVIGGWAVAYAVDVPRLGLPGSAAAMQARFDAMLAEPWAMAFYHAVFLLAAALLVGRGVVGGIERASKGLMPVLIGLLVVLSCYAMVEGDLAAALRFLFALDLRRISPGVALEALGLGFFSIGVGLAIMITYAAHAGREVDLRQVAIVTILSDTAISFCAGLAVFPIVFADNLDPAGGPGLVFVTLPLAFARMPFGAAAAGAFFVLLVVAALASAISMLEMPVALLQRRFRWSRPVVTGLCAVVCWVIGLATVLSFNRWAGWFPLAFVPGLATATMFDVIDQLTSSVLLPICGLALAIFGGWVIPAGLLADELALGPRMRGLMQRVLRYVAIPGILAAAAAPLLLP